MPNTALTRLVQRRQTDADVRDAAYGAAAESDDEVDLREIGRKLWRRKWLILATAATVMVAVVVVVLQLTQVYRGETLVMIDPRQTKVVPIDQVLSGLLPDEETIHSEILVIRSRQLAKETIAKLRLDRDPEINAALRPRPWTAMLNPRRHLPEEWADEILGPPAKEQPLSADEREAQFVDALLARLTVVPEPKSRVIRIEYNSTNPQTAAAVVNTLADFYIVSQMDAKLEATKRANIWLSDHLADLREKAIASDQAVEAYRRKAGLLRGKDSTITAQGISEINSQLVEAQGKRAAAEAKLHQVKAALASPDGIDAIGDVLQSPLIQNLRAQQAQLERRAAELSAQFGERYPAMIDIRAEGAKLHEKIGIEIDKIIQSLRNDVLVARAREAALTESLNQAKAQVANSDEADVQLRALEWEADANRSLYNSFLQRFKETGNGSGDFEQPDARIISRADVPDYPAFPPKKIIFGLATIVSLLAGVGLAFTVERLDQGFRSLDQISDLTGLTGLGLVPIAKRLGGRKGQAYVLQRPDAPFAESIRSLGTKLLLLDGDENPKTVMFASSLPQEGKTTVATSLAYMQASFGSKVAFVDCDLRRPSAHTHFNVPLQPGLVEYLSGGATLADVSHQERRSGVRVIPAGGPTKNPAGLLASHSMQALLETLAKSYDLIVLDSAPVLTVSDGLALCGLVDKVAFVIRWAESRQSVVMRALQATIEAGAAAPGIILSRVNIKKHASYAYADSGMYYGRALEYYRRQ
jgi:polysaccharide biosynthesis transport protein